MKLLSLTGYMRFKKNAAIGLRLTFFFLRVIGVGSQINSRSATSHADRNGKRKIVKKV